LPPQYEVHLIFRSSGDSSRGYLNFLSKVWEVQGGGRYRIIRGLEGSEWF
jgi:hypothetical protein